jgi:hypothetical protein
VPGFQAYPLRRPSAWAGRRTFCRICYPACSPADRSGALAGAAAANPAVWRCLFVAHPQSAGAAGERYGSANSPTMAPDFPSARLARCCTAGSHHHWAESRATGFRSADWHSEGYQLSDSRQRRADSHPEGSRLACSHHRRVDSHPTGLRSADCRSEGSRLADFRRRAESRLAGFRSVGSRRPGSRPAGLWGGSVAGTWDSVARAERAKWAATVAGAAQSARAAHSTAGLPVSCSSLQSDLQSNLQSGPQPGAETSSPPLGDSSLPQGA